MCYNIVTSIKLCAFVVSNCNNLIVMHGMKNVKFARGFKCRRNNTKKLLLSTPEKSALAKSNIVQSGL